MGGAEFIANELAHTLEDVRNFCARTLLLEHPQAALLLLRMCCGTCKVLHLLKILPPELAENISTDVDESMMNAFTKLIGVPLAATAKQQVALPVRLGGFGLTRATVLAPVAAFVGQWSFEERGRSLLNFPATDGAPDWPALLRHLCDILPATSLLPRIWLAEGHLPSPAEEKWMHMKFWSSQVHNKAFDDLLARSSGRNIVRLQCQKKLQFRRVVERHSVQSVGLGVVAGNFSHRLEVVAGRAFIWGQCRDGGVSVLPWQWRQLRRPRLVL